VAEEMFDTGVNMGISWPGIFLQKVLNAFNNKGEWWPDVRVDGQIGPGTLSALKSYKTKRGERGGVVLLKSLNVLQGARYFDIANESFIYGWIDNRIKL